MNDKLVIEYQGEIKSLYEDIKSIKSITSKLYDDNAIARMFDAIAKLVERISLLEDDLFLLEAGVDPKDLPSSK